MSKLKKILIVEDESMIAQDLKEILQDHGYIVPYTADNAEHALSLARTLEPDLVLMDIKLKGQKNGVEAARDILKELNTAIIYLTSYADTSTIQEVKSTQPHGYILKPFREKELLAMIEITLYRHQLEHDNQRRQALFNTTLQETSDAIIILDQTLLIQYMNSSAEKLLKLNGLTPLNQEFSTFAQFKEPRTQETLQNLRELSATQELLLILPNEAPFPVFVNCAKLFNPHQEVEGLALNIYQVSPLAEAQKMLHELLHICASCKKVRNHSGHYQGFDQYFREAFGMKFSHGICPHCFVELYPEYTKQE